MSGPRTRSNGRCASSLNNFSAFNSLIDGGNELKSCMSRVRFPVVAICCTGCWSNTSKVVRKIS